MADFVVNDKRFFNQDGELRPDAETETETPRAETPPAETPPAETPREETPPETEKKQSGRPPLPPADLTALFIGLASSAYIHMGEVPGEENPAIQAPVDLAAAKHSIDLLAVLQEKTKGNLEAEEAELLKTLLYDLRIKFVELSRK